MKTVNGDINTKLLELVSPNKNLWRLRWNKIASEENTNLASWNEVELKGKPSLLQIKAILNDWMNEVTDQRILNECIWNDKNIWLSQQNQTNLKAIFDFAMMTQGANLPIKFKINEGEDLEPIYHTFETLEELTDMYTTIMMHVKTVIDEGWQWKDSVNYEEYENLINE